MDQVDMGEVERLDIAPKPLFLSKPSIVLAPETELRKLETAAPHSAR